MMGESQLPQNWNERPEDWMGGEGEEAVSTYLQQPTTKLKASWLQPNESAEGNPDEKDTLKPLLLSKSSSEPAKQSLDGKPPKKVIQREGYLAERPGDWLGGEGEAVEASHHVHKTKLRTSWMHGDHSISELSFDPTTKVSSDPLHASESHLLASKKDRRQTSPNIMAKLSLLKQKSEENHQANEHLVHHKKEGLNHSDHSKSSAGSKKHEGLGHSEHKKLRDSWISGGENMSTSMRELSSGATKLEDMNTSDSHLGRRRTSALVQERLQGFGKQNEENHKKNEEFAHPEYHPKVPVVPKEKKDNEKVGEQHPKPVTEAHEEFRLQRKDHNGIATRPGDWLGGASAVTSPPRPQKPKVITQASRRKTSPFVLQSTPLDAKKEGEHKFSQEQEKKETKGAGPATRSPKVVKVVAKEEKEAEATDLDHLTPTTRAKEMIRLQRQDHNNMATRPDEWLGGGSATVSPLGSPKRGTQDRRKTSPFVLQVPKLDGETKDTHTLGEEPQNGQTKVADSKSQDSQEVAPTEAKDEPPKAQDLTHEMSPTTAAKEKIRMQRQDHNNMAVRPDDWLGGGSSTVSPLPAPKRGPANRRKTSPFVLQNPLVDA